ncbi:ash family protein [Klebsiella pneumoniae]|uniref:Ash family protein n=1 Tax=Klebsiella pneumoniae TaxID=573 RepID=A0A7X1LN77_KLEPN|nr:ash family protein [Klebsiella pneumoniae]
MTHDDARSAKAPFSGLLPFVVSGYSFIAVAKSTAGRGNPSNLTATPDAPCVFLCLRPRAPVTCAMVSWLL